jgi:hypothetical protein
MYRSYPIYQELLDFIERLKREEVKEQAYREVYGWTH